MSWLYEWMERENLRRYFEELGADPEKAEEIVDRIEAESRYWEAVATRKEDPCEWGAYDCEEGE